MGSISQLHPAIVHFPIALTLTGFLFLVIGYLKRPDFKRFSVYILILAFLSSFIAVYTGSRAGEEMKEIPNIEQALEKHADMGENIRWALGICAILGIIALSNLSGRKAVGFLFFLAYLLSAVLVGYTGYLGGELVLEHGAGYRHIMELGGDSTSDEESLAEQGI